MKRWWTTRSRNVAVNTSRKVGSSTTKQIEQPGLYVRF
jgi:hypothetical protein